jgi:hypothetical protein
MFAHVGRRVGQRLPAVVKATTKTRTFEFSVRNLATYKQSTGLVGLDVDDNGNVTLKEMSLKVLEKAEVLIPFFTVSSISQRTTSHCESYLIVIYIYFSIDRYYLIATTRSSWGRSTATSSKCATQRIV